MLKGNPMNEEYDVNVVYAKQRSEHEIYSEETDFTLKVKDPEGIQDAVSDIVDQEIRSSDDVVIFGSVTITISDSHQLVMYFRNQSYDEETADDLMDLLITDEEIMH